MSDTVKRTSVAIGGALVVGLLFILVKHVVAPPPPVGEIQALESGPYEPGQTIILSLPARAGGNVIYQWKNPDGGRFSSATDTSSTRFVVPDEGPVRIVCKVEVDGTVYEKTFEVRVKTGSVHPYTAGDTKSLDVAENHTSTEQLPPQTALADGVVLLGVRLAKGLDMGIDTSEQRRSWLSKADGAMKIAYPGDPTWGALFITVGKPRDANKPGRDYSRFRTFEIELRGEKGMELVNVGIKDWKQGAAEEEKVSITLPDTDWHLYPFSLRQFKRADLTHLYVVCELVFDQDPETARTIYLRRVRYTN